MHEEYDMRLGTIKPKHLKWLEAAFEKVEKKHIKAAFERTGVIKALLDDYIPGDIAGHEGMNL